MILFKACPRCGGDIDTTYKDDIYCVQCAHRPPVTFASSPAARGRADTPKQAIPGPPNAASLCPRCGSVQVNALAKLRASYNTCYRCRPCGHIFSPHTDGHARVG